MMDRYSSRRDFLRQILRDEQIEAIWVVAPTNVRYLSGFTGSDASILVARDRDLLMTDGRYTIQAARECPGLEVDTRSTSQSMTEVVGEVVTKLGLGSIGFETPHVTVAVRDDLAASAPTVAWKGLRNKVEELRAIKDDDEIAAIREAIGFAENSFTSMMTVLDPDQSEQNVADALAEAMKRQGAMGESFPTIVAVGENAALPHHQPRPDMRIGEADFVLVDWGARGWSSYKSDLTRMVVPGKVTDKFREVYQVVLSAQERALAAIRPGVRACDVDSAARSWIEAAGYGNRFVHGLGHGIGLDIHEDPRIRDGSSTVLRAGMVLTIEPGIYLPGWGGIRLEDDVLVTPDGSEILTSLPKALDA